MTSGSNPHPCPPSISVTLFVGTSSHFETTDGTYTNTIEKIETLFTSGDFSYAKQGIELVEVLIDNERTSSNLESIGSCTLTDFTFDELQSVLSFVSEKSNVLTCIEALGTLAQWNTTIQNLTTLSLYYNQLTTLPDSIKNLTNLTSLICPRISSPHFPIGLEILPTSRNVFVLEWVNYTCRFHRNLTNLTD